MGYENKNGNGIGMLALAWAHLAALPKALGRYRRERLGRAHLLDMDDRLLCDLGLSRREAEAQVEAVRFLPLWRSVARGADRPRRAACRKGCPVPPSVVDGCCGKG